MPGNTFQRLVATPWFLVSIPEMSPGLLPRPRLTALLESSSANFPITIIETPPGFGKATALATMANGRKESTAWVTALAVHADPIPLFSAIISSLLQLYPDNQGLQAELHLLNEQEDPLHSRVATVLSHLPGDENTVMIINDAHLLSKDALSQVVVPLARYSRGQLHFIVAGMQSLTSWLAREIADGTATTLNYSEFLFTHKEVEDLIVASGIDPERIHTAGRCLWEETSGWPVAVQLLLKSNYDVTLDPLSGTVPSILTEYIVDEVLWDLPERLQSFILTTTVSTGISPGLAIYLTGDNNSPALIHECHRRGLFLELLRDEADEPRFRWHPLFAQSCQDILKQRDPERYDQLQRKTAEWLATRQPSAAIEHALKVKDPGFAIRLVEDVWLQMITSGHAQALESLCMEIPTAGRKVPSLLYIRACCRSIQGDTTGARLLKARADHGREELTGEEATRTHITQAFANLLLLDSHWELSTAVSTVEDILTTFQLGRSLFIHGTFIAAWNCLKLRHAPRRAAALFTTVSSSAEIAGFPLIAQSSHIGLITAEALSGRFRVARELLGKFDSDLVVSTPAGPISGQYIAWPDAFVSFWQGDIARTIRLLRDIDSVDGPNVRELDLARQYFAFAAAMSEDPAMIDEAMIMVEKMSDEEHHGLPWPTYKRVASACLHFVRGDRRRTIELLEGIEDHPWAGTTRIIIAGIWLRLGFPDHARRELDHVDQDTLVSFNRALYLKALALIDWMKGNKKRAHTLFESALDVAVPEGVLIPFLYPDEPTRELMSAHASWGTKHEEFLVARMATGASRAGKSSGLGTLLTDREYEVFSFLATPMTAEEIAKTLFISPATVRSHQASIYRKLSVNNRRAAVRAVVGHEFVKG